LSFVEGDWYTLLLAGAAVALAAGGSLLWWRRRPLDPEEVERRRRSYLSQVGRIIEGRILEITEAPPADLVAAKTPRRFFRTVNVRAPKRVPNGARKLVFYSYSISGVTYETAQDITGLEERACLDRVVAGQPASVKYDPANPGNSILVADDWSGLH